MVPQRRHFHPRGWSMEMRESVYIKCKHDKKSWKKIAGEVRNRKGKHPYWKVVRAAFKVLSTDKNQKGKENYSNCVCKKILTRTCVKWLIQKMKELRIDAVCSSTDLQLLLARQTTASNALAKHSPWNVQGQGHDPKIQTKTLSLAFAH
jgi:hypothetical protein